MSKRFIIKDLSIRFASTHIGFYRRYCKNILKKERSEIAYDQKEEILLHDRIWRTIADHYIHNDGGVYLENLGYFCHIVDCDKVMKKARKRTLSNIFTSGYKYISMLVFDNMLNKKKNPYFFVDDLDVKKKYKRDFLVKRGKKYRFLWNEVCFRRQIKPDFKLKDNFSNWEKKKYDAYRSINFRDKIGTLEL